MLCSDRLQKESAVSKVTQQLVSLWCQKTDKEDNKDIALATSKLNYIDPRITVAWYV